MTYEEVKKDEAIRTYIIRADESLAAIGLTEHSFAHLTIAAEKAGYILEELGYRREGNRYLCVRSAPETVALFSHGGSGACALSRLLNLSFPYMCSILPYDFTSIIILNFPDEPGSLVFPRVELFNDARHIYTDGRGPQFAR